MSSAALILLTTKYILNMCRKKRPIANMGIVTISTANPNLDGTGTVTTVLTGGLDGTVVNRILIKATQSTTQGMIRLFINNGTFTSLIDEIPVPACTISATVNAFQYAYNKEINLKNGYRLMVSTEKAENFNVLANGRDWENCECSSTPDCASTTLYQAVTGLGRVQTANSNLNGTGILATVITSPSGADGGTEVGNVLVKAIQSTTEGMIRLFINDGSGSTNYLIYEMPIRAVTQTAYENASRDAVHLGIYLKSRWLIKASTERSEAFTLIICGRSLTNCPC